MNQPLTVSGFSAIQRSAAARGFGLLERADRLFSLILPSRFGYFFVTRSGRLREKPIAAFLEWMQSEAKALDFVPG